MLKYFRVFFVITFLLLVINVVPHFQKPDQLAWLLAEGLLILTFWWILDLTKKTNLDSKSFPIFLIFAVSYLVIFILLEARKSFLYDLWSHLGAGVMKLGTKTIPLGDLAHLTSAAKCAKFVRIGDVLCDPWGRKFNQNPFVPTLFRYLHLFNLEILGVTSIFVFLYLVNRLLKATNPIGSLAVISILSPPIILAVERGNEVITMIFVLLFCIFVLSGKNYLDILAGFSIIIAGLIKIWPAPIGLIFFCLQSLHTRFGAKLMLISPTIFWLCNWREVLEIRKFTQAGSTLGGSYGLQILLHSNLLNRGNLIPFMTLLLTYGFLVFRLQKFPMQMIITTTNPNSIPLCISIMLTFFSTWLLTDSFMYRLIILLPLVILLNSQEFSEEKWAIDASKFIVVCFLSSKFMLSAALTSALALFLLHLSIFLFLKSIKSQTTFRTRRSSKRE